MATSPEAAFRRVEDLVYIETPAIDTLALGAEGDPTNPMQALVDRLTARPDGSPIGFDPLARLTSDVQSEFVDQVP